MTAIDALVPRAIPGGRTLRLTRYLTEPSIVLAAYYGTGAISEDETLPDFLTGGGILVVQQPAGIFDASTVLREVGDRAGLVRVGPHQAAMVHADPQGEDLIRTYDLFWSDGERDWAIVAAVPTGEQVIDLARSVYCP